jgi:hypothetical protein
MASIIKVDQIQSDTGTVNLASNLAFSSAFSMSGPLTLNSPTIVTPTMTGQAVIPSINLTSGQITFPATQNASSNANTLDDYEEGTFTPVFDIEGGGTITASGTTLYGLYTKVGRLVTVNLGLTVQSTSGSGAGNALQFGGLPFTSANINNSRWPITVRLQSAVSSSNYWSGSLASNETGGRIEAYNGTTLINSSTFIGNATIIHITIVYYTT